MSDTNETTVEVLRVPIRPNHADTCHLLLADPPHKKFQELSPARLWKVADMGGVVKMYVLAETGALAISQYRFSNIGLLDGGNPGAELLSAEPVPVMIQGLGSYIY